MANCVATNNHNTMVRTKQARYSRPESTPSLAFERFKEEGNTEGAVVYFPDINVLLYDKTQNFKPFVKNIPENTKINDVFLLKSGDRLIVKYEDEDDEDATMVCFPVVVPDKEQKAKLTEMIQNTGSEVTGELKTIQESVKRIKTLVGTMNTAVQTLCPGFDLAAMDEEAEFDLPLELESLDKLESACIAIMEESDALAVAEPFLKKRKASAADGE